MLPKVDAMELIQTAKPFDDPDWLYEVKYDGFRSLAYIENGACKLVSRNEFNYRRFTDLRHALLGEFHATDAILDGEIVVVDDTGKPLFYDLMANRGTTVFAVFDLLWLDGKDLRDLTLLERKAILRNRMKPPSTRTLYVDHVQAKGKALFEQICRMNLEGIVCKPAMSPYRTIKGQTTWVKVKNPRYTLAEGRGDLFNKRR